MMLEPRGLRLFIAIPAILMVAIGLNREAPSAQGGGGTLDPTFSDDGKFGGTCGGGIPFPFPPTCDSRVSGMALQPDGSFVLAGVDGFSGNGGAFRLRRYTPDGRIDSTFAEALADFSTGYDLALAVAIQPDGRIVAAGGAGTPNTGFAVARFLADGTLDPAFGSGGLVLTPMGYGSGQAWDLVIQPDGKLVVAGGATWHPYGSSQFALARYLPDGQLDPGFGTNGRVYTRFAGSGNATALALLPDGRLVAAGSVLAVNDVPPGFAVTRYLPDGTLDASFGVDGRAVARGPRLLNASALLVRTDGRIVVGGSGRPTPGTKAFTLVGWTADGALDPGFGAGGGLFTTFPSGDSEIEALALQSDGKLVAAGRASSTFALARYLPAGALDPSFGSGGLVTTGFPGTSSTITALVVQPDGKIVGAGNATGGGGIGGGGGPLPAMARYLP